MTLILAPLIGGAIGAMVGVLYSRVRVCSAGQCQARTGMLITIVGWAVFGAAVGRYLVR